MDEQTPTDLQAEVSRLSARVLELEAALAAAPTPGRQAESESRLVSILASLEDIVWSQHPETFEVLFINPAVERVFGYPPEAFIADSMLWFEAIHPDDRTTAEAFLPAVIEQGSADVEYRVIDTSGKAHWIHDRGLLVRDAAGAPMRIDGIATDITARKHAAEEQAIREQQEETIRIQNALLQELSAPMLPIDGRTLVMPLIGVIDSYRAQHILEMLLSRVAEDQAAIVIVDITGIPMVDTQVADGLIRAARAVALLGARLIFTGIRPEVAQTLVTLGVDLSQVTTLSTLEKGIAYARQLAR